MAIRISRLTRACPCQCLSQSVLGSRGTTSYNYYHKPHDWTRNQNHFLRPCPKKTQRELTLWASASVTHDTNVCALREHAGVAMINDGLLDMRPIIREVGTR